MTDKPISHPAKFSDPILATIKQLLTRYGIRGMIVDPFAGVGKVHQLTSDDIMTIGVELEPEWAEQHPQTICDTVMALTDHFAKGSVQGIVTSPTYGNRMADHHEAKDQSTRNTYRHKLGRPLTRGSSAEMQWGPAYRSFHARAWRKALVILEPGGVFVLNTKNHIRRGEVQDVTGWHVETLEELGVEWVEHVEVPVTGNGFGQNGQVRIPHETVSVGVKA